MLNEGMVMMTVARYLGDTPQPGYREECLGPLPTLCLCQLMAADHEDTLSSFPVHLQSTCISFYSPVMAVLPTRL